MSARTAIGLRRDLEILEVLCSPEAIRGAGLGVMRIAQLTGREKSQISRALASMKEEGLVDRDADTLAYRCGWRLYALAASTRESRLVYTASPCLRRLVAQIRETAYLCALRGHSVMTLLTESAPHAFRSMGWEGLTVPVAQTSAGRVLISDWEDAVVRASFTDETLRQAPQTQRVRSVDALIEELRAIRSAGYAKVDGELEEGLVGVSAPVRDFRGHVIAAVNVSAPRHRLKDRLDAAGKLTIRYATQLSHALGHISASAEGTPGDTATERRYRTPPAHRTSR
ncbi:IclR family transcriptional regulator [Streptomyces sp. NPDC048479]|uniref:IclR family transcriptional regulator n=1 Tax=Streptomyces sp. NPDC048479 TaxID=3154725 RepID=UPI003449255E